MEETPRKYASPACALSELSATGADPAYMGWLEPGAVEVALAELLLLAPDAARRQALQSLRPALQADHALDASAPDANTFAKKLRWLLPRLRDDALHAALKRLDFQT